MLRVTQAPQGPVQVKQRFSIFGIASPSYAGRNLVLVVDDQFKITGPLISLDGTWRLNFLFQQTGDRRLRVSIENESLEIPIQVVTVVPPPPTPTPAPSPTPTPTPAPTPIPQSRLRFTSAPLVAQIGELIMLEGDAVGYPDGSQLLLRGDRQFELARPQVQSGKWQVSTRFNHTGRRLIEIIGKGSDRAEITLEVRQAISPTPPPPRLRFTNPPQSVQAEQALLLQGEAEGYADGDQLILRTDGKYELDRPRVQSGKWQGFTRFNKAGRRLIEIIGKGSDRAEITLEVRNAISPTPRPSRLRFTNPPQSVQAEEALVLQGEAENYADGDQLVLRVDGKYELGRPQVQVGKWQASTVLRGNGRRLIEIVGSEQDRAGITIEVRPAPINAQILSRSAWTSNPTPLDIPNLQPQRVTIHHTALAGAPPVNASQAQEAERMRYIWRSHVNGNGWSDIGYHFIIMPSGRVFSARSERKRGAHDVINDGLGVAFDGIYTSATITNQQFQAAVILCTMLCQRYGISDPTTPVSTSTADFGTRNLPRILAHRDRVATECPGAPGGRTVRLEEIRQAVKNRL
jgi:hypothetical protein